MVQCRLVRKGVMSAVLVILKIIKIIRFDSFIIDLFLLVPISVGLRQNMLIFIKKIITVLN